MNDKTCGHEARTADGGALRCLLPPGHRGLHDEPFRLRDGRIEHTNWGDDGLAFWVTSDKKRLRESRGTL